MSLALRKLELAKAALKAVDARDRSTHDGVRFKLNESARRYRGHILGEHSGSAIDAFAPLAALNTINDKLAALKESGAQGQYRAEALRARRVFRRIESLNTVNGESPFGGPEAGPAMDAFAALTEGAGDKENEALDDAWFAHVVSSGALPDELKAQIAQYPERRERNKAEMDRLTDEYERLRKPLYKQLRAAEDKHYRSLGRVPDDVLELARLEKDRLHKEYDDLIASDEMQDLKNKVHALSDESFKMLNEVGYSFKKEVLAQSAITEEQARQWVREKVVFPGNLKAKLKRIGYDEALFRADIEEFYRLMNGRLKPIRFETERGQRAHASGIHIPGGGEVAVASNFDKRTLFHELAHHIELDPAAMAAAQAFIRKRRTSDKTVSLKKLTGRNFESWERAWPDHFLSEYVGKHYKDGVTEVFSMGMERLADMDKLGAALLKDPEHMELMLGYIKQPESDIMTAMLDVDAQLSSLNAEFSSGQEEKARLAVDAELARIDALFPITHDRPEPKEYQIEDGDKKKFRLLKFVGWSGRLAVYRAKARLTGRSLEPAYALLIPSTIPVDPLYVPDDMLAVKWIGAAYSYHGSIPKKWSRPTAASTVKAVADFLEADRNG